jgi:hypothetical protein
VLLSECKFKAFFSLRKLFDKKNQFFFHFISSKFLSSPQVFHKQYVTPGK